MIAIRGTHDLHLFLCFSIWRVKCVSNEAHSHSVSIFGDDGVIPSATMYFYFVNLVQDRLIRSSFVIFIQKLIRVSIYISLMQSIE